TDPGDLAALAPDAGSPQWRGVRPRVHRQPGQPASVAARDDGQHAHPVRARRPARVHARRAAPRHRRSPGARPAGAAVAGALALRLPPRSSAAPAHAEPPEVRGDAEAVSHGDAENAEVLRAQRVGSGSMALRRLRCVIRDPVMWWFVAGESGLAGWSRPRPAPSPAG